MTDFAPGSPDSVETKQSGASAAPRGNPAAAYALAIAGGAVGGALGFALTRWLVTQGLYGMALPGACLGLGCGLFLRRRSIVLGIVAGLAALALGFYTEGLLFPFKADQSFDYFLHHIGELKQMAWVMIGVGSGNGFLVRTRTQSTGVGMTYPPGY